MGYTLRRHAVHRKQVHARHSRQPRNHLPRHQVPRAKTTIGQHDGDACESQHTATLRHQTILQLHRQNRFEAANLHVQHESGFHRRHVEDGPHLQLSIGAEL